MVKESERRIWGKVSRELMTDESDMSDGTIVRDCLPWRSESKSKFTLIASIEYLQDTYILFHSVKCFYGAAG